MLYYVFLVAATILMVALRDTPLLPKQPGRNLSYVLVAPLVLALSALNLSWPFSLVIALLTILLLDRLIAHGSANRPNGIAFPFYLMLIAIEGALPLAVYFFVKANQTVQRGAFLITGVTLIVGSLSIFLVFARRTGTRG